MHEFDIPMSMSQVPDAPAVIASSASAASFASAVSSSSKVTAPKVVSTDSDSHTTDDPLASSPNDPLDSQNNPNHQIQDQQLQKADSQTENSRALQPPRQQVSVLGVKKTEVVHSTTPTLRSDNMTANDDK